MSNKLLCTTSDNLKDFHFSAERTMGSCIPILSGGCPTESSARNHLRDSGVLNWVCGLNILSNTHFPGWGVGVTLSEGPLLSSALWDL